MAGTVRSEHVQLWRCRVQYLRKFYEYSDKKPKQRGYCGPSPYVWFIPLVLTMWATGLSSILLLALNMQQMLEEASALWNLNALLGFNLPLMVIWWHLAMQHSPQHSASSHPKLHDLSDSTRTPSLTSPAKKACLQPLHQLCDGKSASQFKVPNNQRIVSLLLLMLAGDIESNPGPVGKVNTTPLEEDDLFEILEFLERVSTQWYKIGLRLKIMPGKLDTIKKETTDCSEAMTKVILNWLHLNYNVGKFGPPTWEKLVDAVRTGGNDASLALAIAKMHGTSQAAECEENEALVSSTSVRDKFPLLNVNMKELDREEKDALLIRLNAETKTICLSFGGLVGNTEKSLQNSNVTAENLMTFFQNSELEELANSIGTSDSVHSVMNKVKSGGYWSFFNYEVLESMIRYFCQETPTINHLDDYLSKFKVYCQRRVSEVPTEAFTGDISAIPTGKIFKVKMDDKFSVDTSLDSIGQVRYSIQQILNKKPISLVSVDEGCIQLTFRYFDAIVTVDDKQRVEMKEIGVKSFVHVKCRSEGKARARSVPGSIPPYAPSILSTIPTLSCDTNSMSGTSCSTISLSAVKLGPNFPNLCGDKIPREVIAQKHMELDEATKIIKRSYTSLVVKLHRKIEKSQKENGHSVTSLDEIFDLAGNFFDYEVIQKLSYKFGHKKRFTLYQKNFQNYCNRRVCELPSGSSEKIYGLVIDKALADFNVEKLRTLEREMNRVLGHKTLPLLCFDDEGICGVIGDPKTNSRAREVVSRMASLKIESRSPGPVA